MTGEVKIKGTGRKAKISVTQDGRFKYVNWQPGNGTQYPLLFVKLPQPVEDFMPGARPDAWLVILAWTGVTMKGYPFGEFDQPLTWSYVAEKLELRPVDASEVTRVIGTILGRPVSLCTRDEDGEHAGEGVTVNHD